MFWLVPASEESSAASQSNLADGDVVRPPRPDRRLREGGAAAMTFRSRSNYVLAAQKVSANASALKRQASRPTVACAFCNGKPVATIWPMPHR